MPFRAPFGHWFRTPDSLLPAGTVLDMYLPSRGAGGYRRFKDDMKFHVEAKVVLRGTLNNWKDRSNKNIDFSRRLARAQQRQDLRWAWERA